ncbi:hypothetical protein NPIL_231491 [Nephila pilipes]|uniref:Uncharacterized protein n=1 Tax=Nephila pilipes TaxID=299642 RepID=A0A8X6PFR3_NEPPI|nr:hypothetical protein NPIL_231491 [Nephila pilipes]
MTATSETQNNSPQKLQGKLILLPITQLSNKFKALEVDETPEHTEIEITSNNENLAEETASPTQEIKQKRIPPMIIDEALNTPALMDEIGTIVGARIMARMEN